MSLRIGNQLCAAIRWRHLDKALYTARALKGISNTETSILLSTLKL